MEPQDFLNGRTRETQIRRDAAGRWWNGDERVDHPNLARSFDGWVDRAEDGRYCLANDINWAYVEIEGPPYFVKSVRFEGEDAVLLLSGDREETLDPSTLRTGPEGALYCDVRDGKLAARFDNHAAMQLGERLESAGADGGDEEVFRLSGGRFPAPVVDDPLVPTSPARRTAGGC